jgi:hypothetical protein
MASTNFTSSKLSANKDDHFTGIVKLNDYFVCFDNLDKEKKFISINNLVDNQYKHFANNIGVSIYVRFGSNLNFEIPQIKPFDRNLDTPLNFLILEQISNVQLDEYLLHFEKFVNGILDNELFSWRFKVYCTKKLKDKNILFGRTHSEAISRSQETHISNIFLKFTNEKKFKVDVVALVLVPEFIIFLGMNIFDSDYDEIDNKLSTFAFTKKKDNLVNILDYYINENKKDSVTDSGNVEEYIYV